ncbi:MAG TPA: hypothetical protein GX513_07895 [Firmicutes bacterium]|nr:hypothetical protein [Bacillota bacterium]
MGVPFVVTIEGTEHEYVASRDELRAVASGKTEEEAVADLKLAIRALIAQYGREFEVPGGAWWWRWDNCPLCPSLAIATL